jgi:hypothetical protein
VTAAAHRHHEPVLAGGADGGRHVRGAGAAGDQGGAAVDRLVEDPAGLLIAGLRGPQHVA